MKFVLKIIPIRYYSPYPIRPNFLFKGLYCVFRIDGKKWRVDTGFCVRVDQFVYGRDIFKLIFNIVKSKFLNKFYQITAFLKIVILIFFTYSLVKEIQATFFPKTLFVISGRFKDKEKCKIIKVIEIKKMRYKNYSCFGGGVVMNSIDGTGKGIRLCWTIGALLTSE